MIALIKTTYDFIPVCGEIVSYSRQWPQEPDYADLTRVVKPYLNGGELFSMKLSYKGQYMDMFVDADRSTKQLSRNERATKIYQHDYLGDHKDQDPAVLPAIYGPAVLFHRRVWF